MRDQVFISYSQHDQSWLERLQVHLRPLLHQKGLIVWDAQSGVKQLQVNDASGTTIQFNSNGKRLLVADSDKVRLFDATTGQEALNLTGHVGQVISATFSADETYIASTGKDGTLRLWRAPPLDPEAVTKETPTP